MNKEFFVALEMLEKERGIPKEYMLDRVCQALITAHKREVGFSDNIFTQVDEKTKTIKLYAKKTVVPEVIIADEELSLEEATAIDPKVTYGDILNIELNISEFGRSAAGIAKQVIVQGIREAERGIVLNEFSSKHHEILSGTVYQIDDRNNNIIIQLKSEGEEVRAVLSHSEQVRGEVFKENQHIKVYVVDVREGKRGPQVLISRSHPGLVRKLFELEIPEIQNETVLIKEIVREAGTRTKMAVISNDDKIDPISACIGKDRQRIENIIKELNSEPVDLIKFSEDTETFVKNALSPAKVLDTLLTENNTICKVLVSDDQLSLAIGKAGHNVRLAARLTGVKIDIKPESTGF